MNGVQCYLGMRENLVDPNTKEFIITYGKQHKPASSDTTSRWINDELGMADINRNIYTYITHTHIYIYTYIHTYIYIYIYI